MGDIASFVSGGVLAFLSLAHWSQRHVAARVPQPIPSIVIRNALPLVSVIVSPVAWLAPWSPLGFGASGYVATLCYALALAIVIRALGTPKV